MERRWVATSFDTRTITDLPDARDGKDGIRLAIAMERLMKRIALFVAAAAWVLSQQRGLAQKAFSPAYAPAQEETGRESMQASAWGHAAACPCPPQPPCAAPYSTMPPSTVQPLLQAAPQQPSTGTPPTTQPSAQPSQPSAQPSTQPTEQTAAPSDIAPFGAEAGGAVGGETVAFAAPALAPGGYLDDAIPRTQFRLRYDNATNLNRPDRAEYFYATWQELGFHAHPIVQDGHFAGAFFDANPRGPQIIPNTINYRDVTAYFEAAYQNKVSAFVELPVRFVHFNTILEEPDRLDRFPEPPENRDPTRAPGGLSDILAGFKYAFVAEPDRYLTFQFRTYLPSGDPSVGLGTGHVSLEPGLLLYRRFADRLTFQGELEDWIPINAGPLAGNVLTYGLGLSYDVYRSKNLRVSPVVETVGWTILNGFESVFEPIPLPPSLIGVLPQTHGVEDASGQTIVNLKLGLRTYFGEHSDAYIGWGHALTGDRWYKDIIRVEYRFAF
jgi:hypothetical protein